MAKTILSYDDISRESNLIQNSGGLSSDTDISGLLDNPLAPENRSNNVCSNMDLDFSEDSSRFETECILNTACDLTGDQVDLQTQNDCLHNSDPDSSNHVICSGSVVNLAIDGNPLCTDSRTNEIITVQSPNISLLADINSKETNQTEVEIFSPHTHTQAAPVIIGNPKAVAIVKTVLKDISTSSSSGMVFSPSSKDMKTHISPDYLWLGKPTIVPDLMNIIQPITATAISAPALIQLLPNIMSSGEISSIPSPPVSPTFSSRNHLELIAPVISRGASIEVSRIKKTNTLFSDNAAGNNVMDIPNHNVDRHNQQAVVIGCVRPESGGCRGRQQVISHFLKQHSRAAEKSNTARDRLGCFQNSESLSNSEESTKTLMTTENNFVNPLECAVDDKFGNPLDCAVDDSACESTESVLQCAGCESARDAAAFSEMSNNSLFRRSSSIILIVNRSGDLLKSDMQLHDSAVQIHTERQGGKYVCMSDAFDSSSSEVTHTFGHEVFGEGNDLNQPESVNVRNNIEVEIGGDEVDGSVKCSASNVLHLHPPSVNTSDSDSLQNSDTIHTLLSIQSEAFYNINSLVASNENNCKTVEVPQIESNAIRDPGNKELWKPIIISVVQQDTSTQEACALETARKRNYDLRSDGDSGLSPETKVTAEADEDRKNESSLKTVQEQNSDIVLPKIMLKAGTGKCFKCDLCTATFSRMGNFTRHRKIHTLNLQEGTHYKCPYCDRPFLQRCDMKRHTLIHTNEEPFHCSTCGKGYIRKSDLVVHERFHSKQRTFKCDLCKRSFYQSGDLRRHKRHVHAEQSSLTCGHCHRKYAHEATLIRHMKTAHSDILLQSMSTTAIQLK